ncbi:MAG: hypothetical protein HYZ53_10775 [Planctomycetes bacterium]|nr:hypothetical protein [Planctomycetota bacterium]
MRTGPGESATCPKCEGVNPAGQFLCGHCGAVLTGAAATTGAGSRAVPTPPMPPPHASSSAGFVASAPTRAAASAQATAAETLARVGLCLGWGAVSLAMIGGLAYILTQTGSPQQAFEAALLLPWPVLLFLGSIGVLLRREAARIALRAFLWALTPVGAAATAANVVLVLRRPAESRPEGHDLHVFLALQAGWLCLLALGPAATALWLGRRRFATLDPRRRLAVHAGVACLLVGLFAALAQLVFLGVDLAAALPLAGAPVAGVAGPASDGKPAARRAPAAADRPPPILDLGSEAPPDARPPAPRLPPRPSVTLVRPALVDVSYPEHGLAGTPEELAFFPPDRRPVTTDEARKRVLGVFRAERHRLLAGLMTLRVRVRDGEAAGTGFALGFDPATEPRVTGLWTDGAGRLYGQLETRLTTRPKHPETLLLLLRMDADGVLEAAGAVVKTPWE